MALYWLEISHKGGIITWKKASFWFNKWLPIYGHQKIVNKNLKFHHFDKTIPSVKNVSLLCGTIETKKLPLV